MGYYTFVGCMQSIQFPTWTNSLINMHNSIVCIKHSLKNLRRTNPGTLSPPSLHKWEMLSNSNLQSKNLCSWTTHTHAPAKPYWRTRTQMHVERLIYRHTPTPTPTGFTLMWGHLSIFIVFFKPCRLYSTWPIHKSHKIFRFWCVKGVVHCRL